MAKPPPVRVLYLVTELEPGGAERQLAALASGLDRKQYDPAVAGLASGALAKPLREAGVPVFSLGARGAADLRVLPRLKRLLEEVQPDLLHTFLFHANVAGRICARLAKLDCPVVASVRVEDPRCLHRWGESATARWADAFVANSDAMGIFLRKDLRIPAGKIAVIPNAALQLPPVQPGAFRKRLGLSTDAPLIVGVGRLDRQKGFDLLIAAVARLTPKPALALVGEGPERTRLEAQARKLGVALHLPGRLDSAAEALADATLVALPSRWEGMPNVALEAMGLGRPVVGTRVGGIPELLEGGAGILVPPEDPAALAEALDDLLANPPRATALGGAARSKVRRYSVENLVASHDALYRRLLKTGKTDPP